MARKKSARCKGCLTILTQFNKAKGRAYCIKCVKSAPKREVKEATECIDCGEQAVTSQGRCAKCLRKYNAMRQVSWRIRNLTDAEINDKLAALHRQIDEYETELKERREFKELEDD